MGTEARSINRACLALSDEAREQLRGLGFLQQEIHMAKVGVVARLKALLYTPDAAVDIACDLRKPLIKEQQMRIRDRLA